MVRYKKEDEIAMTKFLRFRMLDPVTATKSYMSYYNIAKFINRSISYVYRICDQLRKPKGKETPEPSKISSRQSTLNRFLTVSKYEFTQEQVEYLTNDDTLTEWAHKSLPERLALIKKRYPNFHCTICKLRKLYKEKKIRMKKVRKTKIIDGNEQWRITYQAAELSQSVSMALERKCRVI